MSQVNQEASSTAINPAMIEPKQLMQFLDKGGIISELLDITEEELDSIYAIAYNYYQSNRYEEAESLFQLLCTYNHFNAVYWLGLGAVRQANKQYEAAADTYSAAVLIDVDNPRFPFHAGECHLAMGDLEKAESGFYACSMRSGDNPEFKALKEKSDGLLSLVKRQQAEKENAHVANQ